MLFNSIGFLLCFFPIVVIGFFLIARRSHVLAAAWLGLASLVFYGWWDYRYIPLLLGSIIFNYWSSWKISKIEHNFKRYWLIFAVSTDLALLGYFKYAGFFVSSVAWITGLPLAALHIVLPIGISFFTFTQIAFLVDTYQGKVNERRFIHYVLFVSYFPHLIAGPILHHKEMMPQFGDARNYHPKASNFAIGATFFFLGLAKKVLIADNLSPFANGLFSQLSSPSFVVAWGGVLAYTFQLYFDFSGYSDMAIGLSRIFGIQLPLNFNSPYKARNIAEFWRRWHMTLSRFLRDYLYIPLGGNRKGEYRRYLNLMITMLLGGLWHGAGWNFVIWGGLHGLFLTIHQIWTSLGGNVERVGNSALRNVFCTFVTFIAVCFAWVFFRAPNLAISMDILRGMAGINGLGSILSAYGVTGVPTANLELIFYVLSAYFVAFHLPNTQDFVGRYLVKPEGDAGAVSGSGDILCKPVNAFFPIALGVIAAVALMNMSRPSEFLYFNF